MLTCLSLLLSAFLAELVATIVAKKESFRILDANPALLTFLVIELIIVYESTLLASWAYSRLIIVFDFD